MNLKKMFFRTLAVLGIYAGLQSVALPATHWVGPFKVLAVERNIYGDLVVLTDRPFVVPGGCAPQTAFVVPLWNPGANVTYSAANIAAMQAIAITAMQRQADVVAVADTGMGCIWGAYSGVLALRTY